MNGTIMLQEGTLVGRLHASGSLIGSIFSVCSLSGSMTAPVGYEEYNGSYEVTPSIGAQSMNTEDKHLSNNITIHPIPYYEVSNQNGGNTVIIGG